MSYQHRFHDGSACPLPVGKAVCIGRNYAEHARELNNPVPDKPLLFMKPATAMVALEQPIALPHFGGACHFETELAVLIGQPLCRSDADDTLAAVAGYGLALDLTLRELQNELKAQRYPWEMAKAFDASCPLSAFVTPQQLGDPEACEFTLQLNGTLQQRGDTRQMLLPVSRLLAYCSQFFTLLPGDVVLTGTPAGVGVLSSGDRLALRLGERLRVDSVVA